jgi:predicted RND superfamily exporter protein
MTQLSEEKLKEMLDEHSQKLQAGISKIDKTVGEIKTRVEEQEKSTSVMWLLSTGIVGFTISFSLGSWGIDKQIGELVVAGTVVVMLSTILLLVGVYINNKSSRQKRQE